MKKNLLLVDYENRTQIDLSVLDDSYRAIIFVGAKQEPPKAARKQSSAHRFERVDFLKVARSGKNALDFHIAFHLGRVFETSPETICIVLSGDKGFDPLLEHLNNNGLKCYRIDSFSELPKASIESKSESADSDPELVVCGRCRKSSTIEHHGGRWCTNCGCFASPPDPKLLPSNQPGYRAPIPSAFHNKVSTIVCGWCHQSCDMGDGIYDDGEWMCGGCISQQAS